MLSSTLRAHDSPPILKENDFATLIQFLGSNPEWIYQSTQDWEMWNKARLKILKFIKHSLLNLSTPNKKLPTRKIELKGQWGLLIQKKVFDNHLKPDVVRLIEKDFNDDCQQLKILYRGKNDELAAMIDGLEEDIENTPQVPMNTLVPVITGNSVKTLCKLPVIIELEKGLEFFNAGQWRDAIAEFRKGLEKIKLTANEEHYEKTKIALQKNFSFALHSLAIALQGTGKLEDLAEAELHAYDAVIELHRIPKDELTADDKYTFSDYIVYWKRIFNSYSNMLEKKKMFDDLVKLLSLTKAIPDSIVSQSELMSIKSKLAQVYLLMSTEKLNLKDFTAAVMYLKLVIQQYHFANPAAEKMSSLRFHLANIYLEEAQFLVENKKYKEAVDVFLLAYTEYKKINLTHIEEPKQKKFQLETYTGFENSFKHAAFMIRDVEQLNQYFTDLYNQAINDEMRWSLNKSMVSVQLKVSYEFFQQNQYDLSFQALDILPANILAPLVNNNQNLVYVSSTKIDFDHLLGKLSHHQLFLNTFIRLSITSDTEHQNIINRFAGHIMVNHARSIKRTPAQVSVQVDLFEKADNFLNCIPENLRTTKDVDLLNSCQLNLNHISTWLIHTIPNSILELKTKVNNKLRLSIFNEHARRRFALHAAPLNILCADLAAYHSSCSLEQLQLIKNQLSEFIIQHKNNPHITLIKNIFYMIDTLAHIRKGNTAAVNAEQTIAPDSTARMTQ